MTLVGDVAVALIDDVQRAKIFGILRGPNYVSSIGACLPQVHSIQSSIGHTLKPDPGFVGVRMRPGWVLFGPRTLSRPCIRWRACSADTRWRCMIGWKEPSLTVPVIKCVGQDRYEPLEI